MKAYLELLRHILDTGVEREDRTGIGTLSVFGYQLRIDLNEGFPLLTTKKVYWKGVVHELLWFIRGDTNIRYLVQNGVHIWDEWPFQRYLQANGLESEYPKYSEEWKQAKRAFAQRIAEDAAFAQQWGDLGPVYGRQWRQWQGADGSVHDQLRRAIQLIRQQPHSRRILVSAWNVAELDQMALMPCHVLFQFYVHDGTLSLQLYQRSADVFLGVPFNIASYALLLHMVAHVTGLKPGVFVHSFGDVHLYKNHLTQARLQLERQPRSLPELILNPEVRDIDDFRFEDIQLVNYHPHPAIRAEVAV